jgi:hypothetical protein
MAQIRLCIAWVIRKFLESRRPDCVACADIPAGWAMAGMAITFLGGKAMRYRKLWMPGVLVTLVPS